MTLYRFPLFLCILFLLSGCQARHQPENSTEARLAGLRWPLADTVANTSLRGYLASDGEVERLIVEGSYEPARKLLEERIEKNRAITATLSDETLSGGPAPGEAREQISALRHLAYDYALLWLLDGDPQSALQAREIMLRFADAAPQWPLYDKDGAKQHRMDDAHFLRSPDATGLWGAWHPMDLGASWPLLRAYDMLRTTFDAQEERTVREQLLVFHKELMDRFSGLQVLYNNLWGYHLVAMIRFGQVLEKPEYIDEVVQYLDEQLRYSYAPDGFFREITPCYHLQITSRLLGALPDLVKGVPAGPHQAPRPDLESRYAVRFARIRAALATLSLPDGSYLNLNDSWPKRMRWATGDSTEELPFPEPGLLGVSGVAKLASGGMTAFLKFGGIRGHDHRDALGLNWYAGNREVFSDTGYREQPEKGIHFERAWSSSTASHLTAAVDETLHFQDRSQQVIPDPAPRAGFVSQPPAQTGTHPVEAALPAAARFSNQGRLLLWNADSPQAQAMEAEQENAYPSKASLFRRTLVMVPLTGAEGYLVDLFRIRGGATHDYFLRGNLGEPYGLKFSQPLAPAQGTIYSYIDLKQSGAARLPLEGMASYADGTRVISRLVEVSGTQPVHLQAMLGEAPAIRRPGSAPVSAIRRTADGTGEMESCFVWVHETTSGASRIRGIKAQANGADVTLSIELDDRTDLIFSGATDQSRFAYKGWQFTGRLAYGSQQAGTATGIVFGGGPLTGDGGQPIADATPLLTGKIVATTRRENGETTDSLLVKPDQAPSGSRSFRLAHIDFGDTIRFSIPVTRVEQEAGGLRVELAHTPGFVRQGDAAVMTQFPGWRVAGETRIRLE